MVPQKDAENSIDGACEQLGSFKGKKGNCTQNTNDRVKISKTHNEESGLGELNTRRALKTRRLNRNSEKPS